MKASQKFWYRWMLNYSFGELLGIGAAATIGRLLFVNFSNVSSTSAMAFIILVVAGVAEGLIIGYIQWKSLSKLVLHFRPGLWVMVTILSALTGWLLILPPAVMFISFLSKLALISDYYSVFYSTLAGVAFGGLIGIPQFFIIRKFYKNAAIWIFANTIGWAFSFLVIYSALSLLSNTTSFVYNLFVIVGACILSGLAQGIVTGTSLHFLMSVKIEHKRIS